MSISVVSSVPKTTPASASESIANNTASAEGSVGSQDFLGLLLALGLELSPSPPVISGEEQANKTDESATEGATPGDPSNLLAALGILPTEIKPEITPFRGSSDPSQADSIDTTQSSKALDAMGSQSRESDPLAQELSSLPLETSDTTQGKAARIAADTPALASTEVLSGKESSIEGLPQTNTTLGTEVATKPYQSAHDAALAVRTPLRTADWNQDFGQKIVWLANNDKQSAQITLNPEQMGPIEVSLNVDKGNVSASFTSANAEVREAIETALPRLREMFASAGIELGQTNVSAESFKQQQQPDNENSANRSQAVSGNGILATSGTGSTSAATYGTRQGNGLVDIFA